MLHDWQVCTWKSMCKGTHVTSFPIALVSCYFAHLICPTEPARQKQVAISRLWPLWPRQGREAVGLCRVRAGPGRTIFWLTNLATWIAWLHKLCHCSADTFEQWDSIAEIEKGGASAGQ